MNLEHKIQTLVNPQQMATLCAIALSNSNINGMVLTIPFNKSIGVLITTHDTAIIVVARSKDRWRNSVEITNLVLIKSKNRRFLINLTDKLYSVADTILKLQLIYKKLELTNSLGSEQIPSTQQPFFAINYQFNANH
mgnify:CR=1 FL=1